METNKIDKIVRESFQKRTMQPSASAWERLSDQLDVAEQPKKNNWFKYIGYAASILLLISVAFFINRKDNKQPITPTIHEIVIAPIDTNDLVKPTFNNTTKETVIVKKEEEKKENTTKVERNRVVKKTPTELKVPSVVKDNTRIVVAENTVKGKAAIEKPTKNSIIIDSNALLNAVDKTPTKVAVTNVVKSKELKKITKQTGIIINSDALLYAVSHPNKDINEFYKKYQLDRTDVLKNIKKELKKFNLKIDANTLLTDVEKTIDEETFKKSFMQVVKGKITGLASAIASRNN
ncbi:MAG: hypothetical protein HWD85_08720 [Flavobacteriaceae bacterium]|nr:hypothetical protein [Flavobacteriaceae bacterium]